MAATTRSVCDSGELELTDVALFCPSGVRVAIHRFPSGATTAVVAFEGDNGWRFPVAFTNEGLRVTIEKMIALRHDLAGQQ
jgi:hypothetical protein